MKAAPSTSPSSSLHPRYQCEATTVAGFIQQLAVSYVSNGYFFYVLGSVPKGKDPRSVDSKLVARYRVDTSKWARARRKQAGTANLQYLRHDRLFVILATHGEHEFFSKERNVVRDCRRVPLRAFGYSVSYKRRHVHVRIERNEFRRLLAHFTELAAHRRLEVVRRELGKIRYEPYAPVRRQLLQVLRAVNRTRKSLGYELVPLDAIRHRRRIVRPFQRPPESSGLAGALVGG